MNKMGWLASLRERFRRSEYQAKGISREPGGDVVHFKKMSKEDAERIRAGEGYGEQMRRAGEVEGKHVDRRVPTHVHLIPGQFVKRLPRGSKRVRRK